MRTKETFSLMQSAKEVRVALATDGDRIGELLNQQYAMPPGDGEPAIDYRQQVQHLMLQLDTAVDQTIVAEDQHSTRLIRLSRSKGERDKVVGDNLKKLVATRQGLESVFLEGAFELAFASGETPRVPAKLLTQMGQTVKFLKEPAVEPRQVKVAGFRVDLDEVAAELEIGMPELRAAIDRTDVARKRTEGSLVVKQQAIEELRRIILWVGRTSEGLFHLAGEPDLARRIRSSVRRPRRPSEEAAEAPAEATSSSDEAAPDPAGVDEAASSPAPSNQETVAEAEASETTSS